MNSIFEIDESVLKERAYRKFHSNYVVEADVPNAKTSNTVDGDNEAVLAIKEALDLDGDWKSQWVADNSGDSYTIRFDRPGFRPVIVTFKATIGNSMTFSIQFGEEGNCEYFEDDTPPDDPIVEIARFVSDKNSRFAAIAEQFVERTEEIEREAGDKESDEEEEKSKEADTLKAADQGAEEEGGDEVPPPPGE